jgi:DNA-binding transcriptional ArsR family regulator
VARRVLTRGVTEAAGVRIRRLPKPVSNVYCQMAIYAGRRKSAAPDRLSAIFGALSDPTRRAILDRLRKRPHSVMELAAPFDMTQPSISKHLKVLEQARLVVRGRDAQLRPRALRPESLEEANAYLERFRTLWEARIDRLQHYLAKLKSDE